MLAIKTACLFFLVLLTIFVITQKAWGVSIFFILISISMCYAHHIDYWLSRRSFKKSVFANEPYVVELTDEGFHAKSSKEDSKLSWLLFTKVAHFKDGVLLFREMRAVNWLPFSAMTNSGQTAELEALLRSKIKTHLIIQDQDSA